MERQLAIKNRTVTWHYDGVVAFCENEQRLERVRHCGDIAKSLCNRALTLGTYNIDLCIKIRHGAQGFTLKRLSMSATDMKRHHVHLDDMQVMCGKL